MAHPRVAGGEGFQIRRVCENIEQAVGGIRKVIVFQLGIWADFDIFSGTN